jgi:nucleoside-diphosphate-sugar epimerase
MKAVVTGASGFLGGYLLEALAEESGIEPIALVREGSRTDRIDRLGVERRRADLSDPESLRQGLKGGEIVFHLAGRVSDWGSWREFWKVNVEGTQRLLLAAAAEGVPRFVQVSSISAYGMRIWRAEILTEECPYRACRLGRDFYCRSKHLAEEAVRKTCGEVGMEFVILRPGIIVGERDSAVTRRIVSLIQGGERILNVGPLDQKIQFDHARDVARGVVLAGLHSPANEAYNIASPPKLSKLELWSGVQKALKVDKEVREVPYHLAILWAALLEKAFLLRSDGSGPKYTVWSVYLMGNRNLIEGSKLSRLGWRPIEEPALAIEAAFAPYAEGPNRKGADEAWRVC